MCYCRWSFKKWETVTVVHTACVHVLFSFLFPSSFVPFLLVFLPISVSPYLEVFLWLKRRNFKLVLTFWLWVWRFLDPHECYFWSSASLVCFIQIASIVGEFSCPCWSCDWNSTVLDYLSIHCRELMKSVGMMVGGQYHVAVEGPWRYVWPSHVWTIPQFCFWYNFLFSLGFGFLFFMFALMLSDLKCIIVIIVSFLIFFNLTYIENIGEF
jgi:hypothetical protein